MNVLYLMISKTSLIFSCLIHNSIFESVWYCADEFSKKKKKISCCCYHYSYLSISTDVMHIKIFTEDGMMTNGNSDILWHCRPPCCCSMLHQFVIFFNVWCHWNTLEQDSSCLQFTIWNISFAHFSNLWQNFMLASCDQWQVSPFGTFCAWHFFLGCVIFSSLTTKEQFCSVEEAWISSEEHTMMEAVPYSHERCQNTTGQNQE
jgi:hypothetical protein